MHYWFSKSGYFKDCCTDSQVYVVTAHYKRGWTSTENIEWYNISHFLVTDCVLLFIISGWRLLDISYFFTFLGRCGEKHSRNLYWVREVDISVTEIVSLDGRWVWFLEKYLNWHNQIEYGVYKPCIQWLPRVLTCQGARLWSWWFSSNNDCCMVRNITSISLYTLMTLGTNAT